MARRAARLFGGELNIQDLYEILLFLREKKPTRPLVREVGDLVAHKDRSKGRIFDEASFLFEHLNLAMSFLSGSRSHEYNVDTIRRIFLDNCKRIQSFQIKELGSDKKEIQQLSEKILSSGVIPTIFSSYNTREMELFYKINILGTVKFQFHMSDFLKQFKDSVKYHKLTNLPLSKEAEVFISVFVLSKIHGMRVKLSDGRVCHAGLGNEKGSVTCCLYVPVLHKFPFQMGIYLMRTNLPYVEHFGRFKQTVPFDVAFEAAGPPHYVKFL